MEQNVQVIARKAWHVVNVAYFLLRKNISKRKLLLQLKYLAMKRPKLTGNHHNHCHLGGTYEFSCSNTPRHPFQFKHNKRAHYKSQDQPHALISDQEERELHAVNRVLEMMMVVNNGRSEKDFEGSPYPYSPTLPGFGYGQSPVVRQLRVTDSPYTTQSYEEGEVGDYKVDEDAEEFIKRFYDQLRQQRITCV